MVRRTTAFLAAALLGASLFGASSALSDRDRPGELEGVVSFHCHTEPYLFLEDDKDQSWRVEFSSQDAISHVVAGDRVPFRVTVHEAKFSASTTSESVMGTT